MVGIVSSGTESVGVVGVVEGVRDPGESVADDDEEDEEEDEAYDVAVLQEGRTRSAGLRKVL